ncbi:MAG: PASTA domain-containing protein [Chloroflexi bacterium]|nr:PASTA domain-containing protein [Chloroflexota bacterium]MYE32409.1 PASTA domain-containing protein [Chloroflexota bacterium]
MSLFGGWGPRGLGGDSAADETASSTIGGGADDGLGEWLRTSREERGYDFDRVERDTRISRGYIEAMERDQFDTLPAPVYARGFVRSYARYLGLDEEEALARMPRELPRPPGLEPLPGLRRSEGPAAIPALPWRWVVVGIIVVVAGVAAFIVGVPQLADLMEGEPQVQEAAPAATVGPFEEGTMPNLRNVERAEAERVLAELGVSVIVIEVATNDVAPGRVFGQSPAAGEPLESGDVVNLILSAEPAGDEAQEE